MTLLVSESFLVKPPKKKGRTKQVSLVGCVFLPLFFNFRICILQFDLFYFFTCHIQVYPFICKQSHSGVCEPCIT